MSDAEIVPEIAEASVTKRPGRGSDLTMLELIEVAKDGDRGAFDELVRQSYDDTYTLALRLTGNPDDATDVVQEAYIRAFRGLRRFRGDAQFSTWMYRITANCAATHLSKRNKHRHDTIDEDTVVVDARVEADPERVADLGSVRDRISQAVEALPPKLRAAVVLRDVYGLSTREVAEQLGLTEAAVKVRLHRARKRLRSELFPLHTQSENEDLRAG